MLVHIFVTALLVLGFDESRELGEKPLRQTGLDEHPDARDRVIGAHELHELVAHALSRDDVEPIREVNNGLPRVLGEAESELRDEARRAHHAQRVVSEGSFCGARGANAARDEIFDPVRDIDETQFGQHESERIDREIAPHKVAIDRVAELHLRLARIAAVRVGPVGRDFDGLAVHATGDGAEVPADIPHGLRESVENLAGLFGTRGGREVEVGDVSAEERIAHRPAHEGELVTRGLERVRE